MGEVINELKALHIWAAHHPSESDWLAYLSDMRRLRHQARGVAGLLPKRLPEPCVHCGGQCVQDWADRWWKPLEDGLSDVVRCLGCGMTWGDSAHWLFSTRQHIVDTPAERPDALVTLAQARMIWPDVPSATWRFWLHRDRLGWATSVDAAMFWWQAREASTDPDAWEAWVEAGWTREDVASPPNLTEPLLPEHGSVRGVTLYRVGDMAALVERRTDETRPGRPAQVSA